MYEYKYTNTKIVYVNGHAHLNHLNPTLGCARCFPHNTVKSHVVQHCNQLRHFNVACAWERVSRLWNKMYQMVLISLSNLIQATYFIINEMLNICYMDLGTNQKTHIRYIEY